MSEKTKNTSKDGSNNSYFDVGNIRITSVKKTWDGKPGLRIQAYKPDGRLFQGAEIPIKDKNTAFDLVNGICRALDIVGI